MKPGSKTNRRPRLLLFEQRLIGDAVMSLPFIRSAEPNFEVYVTCGEASAGILKMALPEERIIPWTPPWMIVGGGMAKWRTAGIARYLERVRAVKADVAASVWADPRVHVLMALSGCRERVGFPMTPNNFYASQLPWRRKQIRIGRLVTLAGSMATMRPLLTRTVNRSEYYQHHVEDFHDLARAMDIAWDESRPWLPVAARGAGPGASQSPIPQTTNMFPTIISAAPPGLAVTAPEPGAYATRLLSGRARPPSNHHGSLPPPRPSGPKFPAPPGQEIGGPGKEDRPVWLVHPGARFEGRRWPLESFVRIVREVLVPAGAKVLFARAPELPGELPPLPEGVEALAPAGLPEFIEMCGRADVILCNETGVTHMGAALGKQIVFILSSTEPRWFAPRGSEGNAVGRNVCPHRPCLDHCVMPSYICLEAVTYEMVREKVLSVLQDWQAKNRRG